jgi:hypothetical protein
MTTPNPDAIDAGARALFGNDTLWDHAGPGHRDTAVQQARAAYAAMEPLIRRQVAEEIATEIDRNAALWEEHNSGHPEGIAGARRAASIAREHAASDILRASRDPQQHPRNNTRATRPDGTSRTERRA